MTAEQFAYWLHGFSELNPNPPNSAQWKSICEHLNLVFTKVTPALKYETWCVSTDAKGHNKYCYKSC